MSLLTTACKNIAGHLGQVPSVRGRQCMNLYHKKSSCRLCLKSCPAGAIRIGRPGTRVLIDEATCLGCERCVAVCPTETFVHRGTRGHQRIASMRNQSDKGRLNISCFQVQTQNGHHIRCLNSLSAGDLLELASEGVTHFEFSHGHCQNCLLGPDINRLSQAIATLNLILAAVGINQATTATTDQKISMLLKLSKPVEKAPADISRRALFGRLRKQAATAVASALPEETCPESEQPRYRQRLKRALIRLGIKEQLATQAVQVKLSTDEQRCRRCGVCTKICVTSARKMGSDGDPQHDLLTCCGCGVCTIGCPRQAISIHDPLTS